MHSTDCPTIKREPAPTTSWYWVDETSDPQEIEARYADITGTSGGSGWYLSGRLVTREEASQTALKRCRTCAPDVIPRIVAKRPKQVATLNSGDLGRILDGHPIKSITHEPGSVIVRTRHSTYRFDVTAAVVLDPAPGALEQDPDQPQD